MFATTMKIERTSDSRRIRPQVGQPRYVRQWEVKFTPSLDSADSTIVTPSRLRLRHLSIAIHAYCPNQNRTGGASGRSRAGSALLAPPSQPQTQSRKMSCDPVPQEWGQVTRADHYTHAKESSYEHVRF